MIATRVQTIEDLTVLANATAQLTEACKTALYLSPWGIDLLSAAENKWKHRRFDLILYSLYGRRARQRRARARREFIAAQE